MRSHTSARFAAVLLALAVFGGRAASAQEIYAGKFPQQTGEDLFRNICQGCHMPDARGAIGAGAYPALAGNPKLESAAYPLALVINGRGGMPAFGDLLTDQQVAAVVGYVRTHFGNRFAGEVQAADAKAARP